jgi:hypothetical protein
MDKKGKTLIVRRGADGSIQVDPNTLYQASGVRRQLEATVRVAKQLNLKAAPAPLKARKAG